MIKLVVSDVDGTLVKDGTRDINPRYFEVIRELKALGITFSSGSGRGNDSQFKLFEPVLDDIYLIGNSGATLCRGRELIYQETMPVEPLGRVIKRIRALEDKCDIEASAVDHICVFPEASEVFLKYMESYGFEIRHVTDASQLPSILHIGVYHDPEKHHPVSDFMHDYDDELTTNIAGREWVDFMPKGISKGKTLKKLQEILNISPEETMVFGDQDNDVSMMKAAKYSYAVGGAAEVAKAAAAYICPPREEDGVLQVLETLLRQKGEMD